MLAATTVPECPRHCQTYGTYCFIHIGLHIRTDIGGVTAGIIIYVNFIYGHNNLWTSHIVPSLISHTPNLTFHTSNLTTHTPNRPYTQPDLPHTSTQADYPHSYIPYTQHDLSYTQPDLPYTQPDYPHTQQTIHPT